MHNALKCNALLNNQITKNITVQIFRNKIRNGNCNLYKMYQMYQINVPNVYYYYYLYYVHETVQHSMHIVIQLMKNNYKILFLFSEIHVIIRDGTKPIPNTRSIGYRVNFKVSVSPKNPLLITSTFRYYFDTFRYYTSSCIIMMSCNEIQQNTIR